MTDDRFTPQDRAEEYRKFQEDQFERIKFEPKPISFMKRSIWKWRVIWSKQEINRRAWRLFFVGFMIFMATASVYFYYGDTPMPRATMLSRIAAAIFLLAVVANFIAEFGWLGGKRTNASHMD